MSQTRRQRLKQILRLMSPGRGWNYLTGPPRSNEHQSNRRAFLGFAMAAGAGVLAKQISSIPHTLRVKRVRALPRPRLEVDSRAFDFHTTEVNCAEYVEVAAQRLFGMDYIRDDAWRFASRNKSLWRQSNSDPTYPEEMLKPGLVVGIFHPDSAYNQTARAAGTPYTHLAMIVGFERVNGKNEPVIVHFFGGKVREDYLNRFVEADGGEVREIIGPKRGVSTTATRK